ncbi:hypothetical protein GC175_21850 [bacterium]|nr:hypothetical protein [bacterium]
MSLPQFVPNAAVLDRMQAYIQTWEACADDKALFLRCYFLMTSNMFSAVETRQFDDPVWVHNLLHHFADYYFDALHLYEQDVSSAPLVWQFAHDAACSPGVSALQKLLLGINAHINYDLVLAVTDMLTAEWHDHTAVQRASRYNDHCHVNQIIGQSIDAVQDQVLGPAMPMMELFDRLLGPVDEILISRLITAWRENVWRNAAGLLDCNDPQARGGLVEQVHADAVKLARFIAA